MKKHHACPKCESTDIIGGVRPLDSNEGLARLADYRNPDALLLKGRQSTTLSAWVCAECGFVEFYADDPKVLKRTDD